jgi:membrane-bound metal-dependent hydrolase YbcI (DUF457 family)
MVEMDNNMPSPFGHALGGIAVSWIADLFPGRRPEASVDRSSGSPAATSFYQRAGGGVTLICAGLGMAPDADLVLTTHRTVTHSIGAVAVVMIVAAAVTGWVTRRTASRLRFTLTCGAAYAGHLLLDWLAVDRTPPFGLQMFWPLSHKWYISGIDLFEQTERRKLFSLPSLHTNLVAISWEAAILLSLLAGLWLIRVKTLARFAAEQSGRHHPAQERARPVL